MERSVRKLHPLVVPVAVAALVIGGGWLWPRFAATILQALRLGDMSPLSWLPPILFSLIMIAALQLADTAYALYLKPLNELLLTAPLPQATLFVVKWLECSRLTLLPGFALGAVLMAVVHSLALPWSGYLFGLLATLLTAAGLTTLGMLMVMLIVRLLPFGRLRTILPIFLTLTPVVMLAFQDRLMGAIQRSALLTGLSDVATLNITSLSIGVGAGAAVVVLMTLGAAELFRKTYQGDWSRMLERPDKPGPAARQSRLSIRLPLPPSMRAIITKDWLETLRQPGEWIGLLIQPLLVVLILLPGLRSARDNPIGPLFFWMAVLMTYMFGLTTLINQAMAGVASEGRCLTLLKSAPLRSAWIHRAKWLGARWILALPIWGAMLLLLSIAMHWALGVTLLVVLTLAGILMLGTHMTVSLGMRWTDFGEIEPKRRIPRLVGLAVMVMGFVLAGVGIWTAAWLTYRFFPNQAISLPLQIMTEIDAGVWLLGSGWQSLLVLIGVWAAGMYIGWWMKRSALVRWEGLEA
jgi:hypothetical protein